MTSILWEPIVGREATAKIRTSPAGSNQSSAGFTLLELLVTLAILAVALTVAVPAFDRMAPGFALRAAAREAAAMLREARGLAISQNREVAVIVDLDARTIGIDASTQLEQIDQHLGIDLYSAAEELIDQGTGRIRFYPDGSSTGGHIGLSSDHKQFKVTVSWITGAVAIHE